MTRQEERKNKAKGCVPRLGRAGMKAAWGRSPLCTRTEQTPSKRRNAC